VSALAPDERSESVRGLALAQDLDRELRNASPREIIAKALQMVGREHLALVSSFGTESAALLKVMAEVDPAIPVIFLDTGWLFEETLAYRDTLIARLGLRNVRSIKPLEQTLSREDRFSIVLSGGSTPKKLNELLAASKVASNRMIGIEDLDEQDLREVAEFYVRLAARARNSVACKERHSIDEQNLAEQRS